MKRDSIKTVIGLAIIGGIVVVTFLYGNAQRQAQIRHDQDVKNQQAKVVAVSPTAPPSASVKPTGPSKGIAAPSPEVVTIPNTGPAEESLIGLASIILAGVLWRGSMTRVRQAARARI